MKLQEIKEILSNRLRTIEQAKTDYYNAGDLEKYSQADLELQETLETLSQIDGGVQLQKG